MAGEAYSKNGIKVIRVLHVSKNSSTIKNTKMKTGKKAMRTKIQTNLKPNETLKITFKILPSQQLLTKSRPSTSSNLYTG